MLEYLDLKSSVVYLLCINFSARCDEVRTPAIHIFSYLLLKTLKGLVIREEGVC